MMNRHVEAALWACGRDRILHREGFGDAEIAIRYDIPSPAVAVDGTQRFLVRRATSLDEAGKQAAVAFAAHLRARAKEAIEWAERIDRALSRDVEIQP